MVSFGFLVLISLVIIFVTLVFLVFLGIFQPFPTPDDNLFEAQVAESSSLQQGFCENGNCNGQAISCPNETNSDTSLCRGNCLLYETFSTETNIVDGLEPIANINDPSLPSEFKCSDGFTMALSKREATCNDNECVGRDGTVYSLGQTEQFYSSCGSLPSCSQNFRSAVVFRFEQTGTTFDRGLARCLSSNIQGSDVIWDDQICPNQVSLTDETFLNVVQYPCELELRDARLNGFITQIRAPVTGECLSLENDAGTDVIPEPCLSMDNNGFVWFYFPGEIVVDNIRYSSQLIYLPNSGCSSNFDRSSMTDKRMSELRTVSVFNSSLEVGDIFGCPTSNSGCNPNVGNAKIIPSESWICLN